MGDKVRRHDVSAAASHRSDSGERGCHLRTLHTCPGATRARYCRPPLKQASSCVRSAEHPANNHSHACRGASPAVDRADTKDGVYGDHALCAPTRTLAPLSKQRVRPHRGTRQHSLQPRRPAPASRWQTVSKRDERVGGAHHKHDGRVEEQLWGAIQRLDGQRASHEAALGCREGQTACVQQESATHTAVALGRNFVAPVDETKRWLILPRPRASAARGQDLSPPLTHLLRASLLSHAIFRSMMGT